MDHLAHFGMAFAFRHAPLLRRRADQQYPGTGAHAPQLLPRGWDAGTASGELHAEASVVIHRRDRRGLDADAAPVGLQFLRHQHRQRSVDALPHLGFVDDDGDAVVRRDADEGIRRICLRSLLGRCLGGKRTPTFHRQIEADHQTTRQGSGTLEELAARGILHGHDIHFAPPCISAARWIAERTRL